MIGQKLILPTGVQAEIDEIAEYMPVQSSPATDINTLSWGLSLFVSRRGLHFFIQLLAPEEIC